MKIAYALVSGAAVIAAAVFTALGVPLIIGAAFLCVGIIAGVEAYKA